MAAILSGRPRLLVTLVTALSMLFFFTAGWAAWFSYDLTAGLPDKQTMRSVGEMAQSTTIHDLNNEPVFTIFKEQRVEVPLDQISPHLIKAVLSVEDQRFYDHNGVDAVRVIAAVLRNVQAGRRAEGGSTITQQLARLSFLNRDKTYRRKVKEIILAAYLESFYSKDELLELYLNKVYLGDGYYGVETASLGYFGKKSSQLDVDEAALIAGLIQSPSAYAPSEHLEKAVARRNVVLETMVNSGAIDEATAASAKRAKVRLVNGLEIKETYGLYFKEQVRRELVERFGWDRVYEGGLKVYTTLDSELQKAAEQVVEKGLRDIERRAAFKEAPRGKVLSTSEAGPDYLQGALVSIDPATGHVLAMVGGRDFRESRFNRVVQAKRQSGSAFKPFVFAAALEAGYSPASIITNLNASIETPEGDWVPEDEHSSASSMTLRTALKTSSNRAAVQLLNTVGIPTAVGYAERLNVGTPPSVPSLALGASDVTLLSLTSAYAAFAARGVVRDPVVIRRVEDDEGHVLYQDPQKGEQAVSEETAFLISSMLSDVITAGTGYRARQYGFTMPAAGKTGTTNNYVDAWFVGYTPRVVTGVWVGFDRPRTIVSNGYGGELAVPIWAEVMKLATRGDKPEWFERPANVVPVNICRVSGKRPNGYCGSVPVVTNDGWVETRSQVYTEFFVKGTEPGGICTVHAAPVYYANSYPLPGDTPTTVEPAERAAEPPPVGTSGGLPPVAPPPRTAPPAGQPDSPATDAPAPRRGFWGRLFGRGQKNEKPPDKPAEKPAPKKKPNG